VEHVATYGNKERERCVSKYIFPRRQLWSQLNEPLEEYNFSTKRGWKSEHAFSPYRFRDQNSVK
jgi:hypothetical protein